MGVAAAEHLKTMTETQQQATKNLMDVLNTSRIELDNVGECVEKSVDRWNAQFKELERATSETDVQYKDYVFKELRESSKYRLVAWLHSWVQQLFD